MRNRQHPNYSNSPVRKSTPRSLPSMATPRRPQPPKKSGFAGAVFFVAILGGLVWLVMLIFGMGPYAVEEAKPTSDKTQIPTSISIVLPGEDLPILQTSTQTVTVASTPTATLTPTFTPSPTRELMPFILIGEPETMSSDYIRPSLGCDWLVIAGQVWDLQDAPVKGLTLHLYGELDGFTIDQYSLTGSAQDYGESGYEFMLENLVVTSQDALFIQLVDSDGVPFSHSYALETFEDCQKNLILVNFKQVR